MTPLGNLRTSDCGGPYNISLLDRQANEVRGARREFLLRADQGTPLNVLMVFAAESVRLETGGFNRVQNDQCASNDHPFSAGFQHEISTP